MEGYTQTELAENINRDRQIIQRLEKGKTNCSINLIRIIAKALDVEPFDIFKDLQVKN